MTDTMEHRVVNENDTEVRVTNSVTGGEKGSKVARFDLVPPRSLKALAEHFGKACIEHGGKYEARNWQKGTNWSLNYAAAMRHFTQWWSGEDLDEDGNSHLAACMWHACVLIEFAATHPELDDRPTLKPVEPFTIESQERHMKWIDEILNRPSSYFSPRCGPETAADDIMERVADLSDALDRAPIGHEWRDVDLRPRWRKNWVFDGAWPTPPLWVKVESRFAPTNKAFLINPQYVHREAAAPPYSRSETIEMPEWRDQVTWSTDREPQPTDGPDYHADHEAWERRNMPA